MTRAQPKCNATQGWLSEVVPDPQTRFIWQRNAELVLAQARIIWSDLIYVLCHSESVHAVPMAGGETVNVRGHTLDGVALTVAVEIYPDLQTLKIVGISTKLE